MCLCKYTADSLRATAFHIAQDQKHVTLKDTAI